MKRLVTTDDLFRIRWLADPQLSPDGQRLAFTVTALERERDVMTSQVCLCDIASGEVRAIGPREAYNHSPCWSPDGRQLVVVSNERLWLTHIESGAMRQLTAVESSEPSWSHDSRHIVFVATHTSRKQMWRVSVADGVVAPISSDDWDATSPCWQLAAPWVSPNGIHIALLSNRSTHPWNSDIWLTTPDGDEPRKLTHSTGPIRALAWSPDSSALAYIGHDQGHAQGVNFNVWSVSLTDGATRNLTAAFDRSAGLVVRADDVRGTEAPSLHWTDDGIYFAFADGGYSHIGKVTPNDTANDAVRVAVGGNRACLSFSMARGVQRIAFVASDALNPGEIFIADGEGNARTARRVTNFNDAWLSDVSLSAPQQIAFTASDGQLVESWLMRPPNVSVGQRYPLILQIHGGPHYPLGERFYFDFQRLAAQGYAILYVNMRGSQGYGEAFATQIRGAWGERDYHDVLEAVDVALSSGEVDESRLAVTGVSYGGYMANWIIGHTARFRAAICENGISNLVTNFATSAAGRGEAFWTWEMGGAPATQPERYRALSPITYAENIHTPLLLIHAEQDTNCAIAQSEELYAELQRLGREVALVRIPDEGHLMNLVGKPSHRLMRMKAMDAWWTRWL